MCALLGLAWLSWFGREGAGGGRYPTPQASPASPASNTHQCIRVCLLLLFHIYIYIYAPHHTDRQTDRHRSIDRSLSILSLSLSLYIVLVLVACTLSHHHHTTRAVRVYVCVCIWLPFEQCFRHPDNRPHNDIICRGQTTGAHRHHSNAPRHALLGAGHGVLCVYWCVLLRSCRQRWTGRNTCRPAARPPACCHKSSRQAGVQETGTHLPTMLLLLL